MLADDEGDGVGAVETGQGPGLLDAVGDGGDLGEVDGLAAGAGDDEALEGRDGILSISITHGFPWGDVVDMGTRVLVYADGEERLPLRITYSVDHKALPAAAAAAVVPAPSIITRPATIS